MQARFQFTLNLGIHEEKYPEFKYNCTLRFNYLDEYQLLGR